MVWSAVDALPDLSEHTTVESRVIGGSVSDIPVFSGRIPLMPGAAALPRPPTKKQLTADRLCSIFSTMLFI